MKKEFNTLYLDVFIISAIIFLLGSMTLDIIKDESKKYQERVYLTESNVGLKVCTESVKISEFFCDNSHAVTPLNILNQEKFDELIKECPSGYISYGWGCRGEWLEING